MFSIISRCRRLTLPRYVLLDCWLEFVLMTNPQLTEKFGLAKVKEMLNDIVNSCYDSAVEKQNAEGYIVLERGLATIPLAGLDVPFHSRYLWSGVMPFRGCESTTPHACIKLSDSFQIFRRRFLPIFWTPRFSRGSIFLTWSHRRSRSTRLTPRSYTVVLHRHVSRKFFANGMMSVGMHLSRDRSSHGFSSLSYYHTSLRPRCAGSKLKTCSSNNTSSSASLRLAHLQRSWAWLLAP